jgi:hypothetical protein
MKGSYLVILPQARHIEFGISLMAPWKKFMMLSLMKHKDLKNEAQNLDDMRGYQLANAMRNMDIGDVRPRQVDDDDDDIHVINQSVQIDTNQSSSSGTHDESQDQGQASESNQLPILQPTNIARDHPLDQIIGGI